MMVFQTVTIDGGLAGPETGFKEITLTSLGRKPAFRTLAERAGLYVLYLANDLLIDHPFGNNT
jgi:hypothetical protein